MEMRKLAPPKTSNPANNIVPARIFAAKQAQKPKINFEELVERQRDHNFLQKLIKQHHNDETYQTHNVVSRTKAQQNNLLQESDNAWPEQQLEQEEVTDITNDNNVEAQQPIQTTNEANQDSREYEIMNSGHNLQTDELSDWDDDIPDTKPKHQPAQVQHV